MHTLKKFLSADGLVANALERSVRGFAQDPLLESASVLDLGCGTMPYRHIFSHAAQYIGADIDGDPDLLIRPDAPLPLDDGSFDVVVSFQVLEHVRDVSGYLESAKRVLKPGGRLFLSTHGVWPYHPHPTDYWRWTRDGLQEIIGDAGFHVVKITPLCGPAAWMSMFPALAAKKLLGPASWLLAPFNLAVNLLAGIADRLTPSAIKDTNAAVYAVEAVRRA